MGVRNAGAGGDAWASLSLYESPELVRRLAQEATGHEPNAAKAREISSHFSQGRAYFQSASDAGELVRPLLLYYGAMALARGAVFFLDPGKSKVETSHGLETPGWPDLLSQPDALAGSTVRVDSSGTFPELVRVTGNSEWVRVQSEKALGVADAHSPGGDVAAGATLTVKEILGQIPDVAGLYGRTSAEHSRRLRAEVIYTGSYEYRAIGEEIPPDEDKRRHSWVGVVRGPLGYPEEGWAEGLMEYAGLGGLGGAREETFRHFARFPEQAPVGRLHPLHTEAGSLDQPLLRMPVAASASGEEYLKLSTDGGVVLSTLLALHLVAYATGTLVRYHPGSGGSVGPILSAAVSAVEERYPALVLEALE